MKDVLRTLLNALDVIGQSHEEIYDTVCREKMGDVIFNLFIRPESGYVASDDFGLYDTTANLAVKKALIEYTIAANRRAAELGIDTFHSRMAAFQDEDVRSDVEKNYFDDFFGWMNPDDFDEDGVVKR